MGFLGWLGAEWQKDCPVDSPCQTLRRWRPCDFNVDMLKKKDMPYKKNVKRLHACVYIYTYIYIYLYYMIIYILLRVFNLYIYCG